MVPHFYFSKTDAGDSTNRFRFYSCCCWSSISFFSSSSSSSSHRFRPFFLFLLSPSVTKESVRSPIYGRLSLKPRYRSLKHSQALCPILVRQMFLTARLSCLILTRVDLFFDRFKIVSCLPLPFFSCFIVGPFPRRGGAGPQSRPELVPLHLHPLVSNLQRVAC